MNWRPDTARPYRRRLIETVGLVTLVLLSPRSIACSCVWDGRLDELAARAPIVIRGEIVSSDRFPFWERLGKRGQLNDVFKSIRVRTLEVLKGPDELPVLVIEGDNGMLCRPYLLSSQFIVGAEYLFVLHSEHPRQPLSVCGEHWARVEKNHYVGTGRDGKHYESSLNALRAALRD